MRKIVLSFLLLFLLVSCGKTESVPIKTPDPEDIVEIEPAEKPEAEEPPGEIQPEEIPEEVPEEIPEKAPEKVESAPCDPAKPVVEEPETKEPPKKEEPETKEPEVKEEPVAEEKKTLCTLSVTCHKIVSEVSEKIPADGYVLSPCYVEFKEGECVFDIMKRGFEAKGISFEYEQNSVYNSVYIQAIGGIREKDFGAYSGWMYKVNGAPPTCGCDEYIVKEGDVIEFYYSR